MERCARREGEAETLHKPATLTEQVRWRGASPEKGADKSRGFDARRADRCASRNDGRFYDEGRSASEHRQRKTANRNEARARSGSHFRCSVRDEASRRSARSDVSDNTNNNRGELLAILRRKKRNTVDDAARNDSGVRGTKCSAGASDGATASATPHSDFRTDSSASSNTLRAQSRTTSGLSKKTYPLVRRVTLTKSSEDTYGLFIQGGIDSPYIVDGEERTSLLVKDLKAGSPADHQRVVKAGDEILRINGVSLEGKRHNSILNLITAAGNSLDLDVIIKDYNQTEEKLEETSENDKLSTHSSTLEVDQSLEESDDADEAPTMTPAFAEPAKNNNAPLFSTPTIDAALAGRRTPSKAAPPNVEGFMKNIDRKLKELRQMRQEEEREERRHEWSHDTAGGATPKKRSPRAGSGNVTDTASRTSAASSHDAGKTTGLNDADAATTSGATPSTSSSMTSSTAPPRRFRPSVKPADATAARLQQLQRSHLNGSDEQMTAPTLMWNVFKTHVMHALEGDDDSNSNNNEEVRDVGDGARASGGPSVDKKGKSLNELSPYHIPIPSPAMEASPVVDRSGAYTPYPIIFPRTREEEENLRRRTATPAPPTIDPATVAREAVEATLPSERPPTSGSIHDPTDRGSSECEETESNAYSYTDDDEDDVASDDVVRRKSSKTKTLRGDESASLRSGGAGDRSNADAASSAYGEDDGTEADAWTLEGDVSLAAVSTDGSGEGREEDHVYLFVGTMTLVVASAILVSYVVKRTGCGGGPGTAAKDVVRS